MKKLNVAHLLLLLLMPLAHNTYAQTGWFPAVSFPPGKYLCDTARWKLVLSDNFTGSSINPALWYTFNTNNGVNHDNWGDARAEVYGGNTTIVRDANVQVSGGTVKLKMRQETGSWKCDTCPGPPRTRNYTSGYIGSKMIFNKGARVETRLRMPIFPGSWNTCWLWALEDGNEIDFAESWSNNGMPSYPYFSNSNPHNNYNLHSWRPRWDNIQPYIFPEQLDISNRYPGQEWPDWLSGTRFRYEDWHKYTCDWDTASVTIYLDDVQINKFWKYSRHIWIPVYDPFVDGNVYIKVWQPSTCYPQSGNWQITKGYPWNSHNSRSKLIFSVASTRTDKIYNTDAMVELGQMEIDYVRVYQRHPEQDGHTEICTANGPAVTINGPGTLCGTTAYSVSQTYPGSTWSISNNAAVFGGGAAGGASKLVEKNPYSSLSTATLNYTYSPAGSTCPEVTASKVITIGQIPEKVFTTRVGQLFTNKQNFNLWVTPNTPGATYHWKVWYGRQGPENYMQATGQYISTPTINHNGLPFYYLRWELLVATPCGSKVITGTKVNSLGFVGPLILEPQTFMTKDSLTFNLDARFDTEEDWNTYQQSIENQLSTTFVEDIEDSFAIIQLVNKVRVQCLEPYLYFEDRRKPISGHLTLKTKIQHSEIYPNPASQTVHIKLSEKFDGTQTVNCKIYNTAGESIWSDAVLEKMDISTIATGTYILELQQGSYIENIKFVKQ